MKESEIIKIFGVNVYPYTSPSDVLDDALNEVRPLYSLNPEFFFKKETGFKDLLNRGICYADGVSVVMALKRLGAKNVCRIPGCELWLKLIEKIYQKDASFYLIGSSHEVAEKTVEKLKNDFPGINIAGWHDGFFDKNKEKEIIADVVAKKPTAVFVTMGCPKQEILIDKMYSLHKAIYMDLGGSFNVYTNAIPRAPKFWRDHGLEWAYRVIRQPSKIKGVPVKFKFWILTSLGFRK